MSEPAVQLENPLATVSHSEMIDLARYRATAFSDEALAVAHWVADGRFNYAAKRILSARHQLNVLAAYVSRLAERELPHEAPPTPAEAAAATSAIKREMRHPKGAGAE